MKLFKIGKNVRNKILILHMVGIMVKEMGQGFIFHVMIFLDTSLFNEKKGCKNGGNYQSCDSSISLPLSSGEKIDFKKYYFIYSLSC